MKNKKIKLIISLVSFCFCIAVLCFGVFSAIQVEYKTTGSIKYKVEDVFTKIETQIYHSTSTELTTEKQLRENIVTFAEEKYQRVSSYTQVQVLIIWNQ